MNKILSKSKMAHNDKIPELTNGVFNDYIKEDLVLIDFSADWCMPCVMMAPIMDDLADKFKGKIRFGKVNVDENYQLASKFNVSSIPNFVLFKNGKVVQNFIGSMPEEDFEEKLKKFI